MVQSCGEKDSRQLEEASSLEVGLSNLARRKGTPHHPNPLRTELLEVLGHSLCANSQKSAETEVMPTASAHSLDPVITGGQTPGRGVGGIWWCGLPCV